ncbi:MAG: hemerythrin family protein [Alphaproteobacteria bacterium]|nr:hemerythrin family protein [Alphaproteobacteria bacterium]
MALIAWDDAWLVGHGTIDYDHQMLVNITNQIYEIRHDPTIKNAQVFQTLQQLVSYVERHFAREEAIFDKTDYPDAAAHKQMHRELERVVREIVDLWRREPDLLNFDEVIEFLRRWLIEHILKHDHKYKPFL